MFHLLLWGSLPTDSQRTHLSQTLARCMEGVPQIVHWAIQVLPYVYRAPHNPDPAARFSLTL